MTNEEFEASMRKGEYFHTISVPPGMWTIIRVDGRGFSKKTADLEKPFSKLFHGMMVEVASALMTDLGGIFGYTESDEISILLPRDTELFDRELEKLVSVSAGLASAAMCRRWHFDPHIYHFDSRLWIGTDFRDYFTWRQSDALRCSINGWCYWMMIEEGKSAAEATSALYGKDFSWKNEWLFKKGINFNDLPLWQRRGTGLHWESYQKQGLNPITNETVTCNRRRLFVNEWLPTGQGLLNLFDRLEEKSWLLDTNDGPVMEQTNAILET